LPVNRAGGRCLKEELVMGCKSSSNMSVSALYGYSARSIMTGSGD
jgi:hypothetical protein